jgi:hypothetical protein
MSDHPRPLPEGASESSVWATEHGSGGFRSDLEEAVNPTPHIHPDAGVEPLLWEGDYS